MLASAMVNDYHVMSRADQPLSLFVEPAAWLKASMQDPVDESNIATDGFPPHPGSRQMPRWDGGELNTTFETRRSIWTSMQKRLAVGKDLDGPGLMYVLNFGPCVWDGEVGQVYMERSDPLNAPGGKLWAAGA